jgi:hypothetical protein
MVKRRKTKRGVSRDVAPGASGDTCKSTRNHPPRRNVPLLAVSAGVLIIWLVVLTRLTLQAM